MLRDVANSPHPVRQLWRGTLTSTIRTSLGSALYFATLERLRRALATAPSPLKTSSTAGNSSSSALPRLSTAANLAAGAVARASVGFVLMPVTVLKVRFESSTFGAGYSALGLFGAARDIAARDGPRAFFAGAGVTALRDAPYAGLYVAFYEWAKGAVGGAVARATTAAGTDAEASPARLSGPAAAGVNFASGALAAALATTATNPPDAVKTRVQLAPSRYSSSLAAARSMLREEGVRVFFDGLGLRVTRKALSSALAWTLYEELVRGAEQWWVKKNQEE